MCAILISASFSTHGSGVLWLVSPNPLESDLGIEIKERIHAMPKLLFDFIF
jgi:hypothetical protein